MTANHDSPWQHSFSPYLSTLETFPDLAADNLLVAGAYGLHDTQMAMRSAYKTRQRRQIRHAHSNAWPLYATILSVSHLRCGVMRYMLDVLDNRSSACWLK